MRKRNLLLVALSMAVVASVVCLFWAAYTGQNKAQAAEKPAAKAAVKTKAKATPAKRKTVSAKPLDMSRVKLRPPVKNPKMPKYPGDDLWSFTVVRYDEKGPRVKWETFPGGPALEIAASNYAILTGDFDVSLKDVIDSGLWPYNIFPKGTDLNGRLYGFKAFEGIFWDNKLKKIAGPQPGTPEWWAHVRWRILDQFHENYYYTILDPVHLRMPKIGERYPAFWTNPDTGKPMKDSKDYGDYSMSDMSEFMHCNSRIYDVNYFITSTLTNVDAVYATLQKIPLKADKRGMYQIDLHLFDPEASGTSMFYNTSEKKMRSRSTAIEIAKTITMDKVQRDGKLEFHFKVPRINSIRLPKQ
jgi:hypothetical protein